MSLKKNILASYASQIYVTAIGILVLPTYVQYLGVEAYGLVGFYSMLQAWFALFDMGLTPTIARETARFHGGATTPLDYKRVVRSLNIIFLLIALVGGGALYLMAEDLAQRWLNIRELKHDDVVLALRVMAVSVALRWLCGLYRGIVSGAERITWLSSFNIAIASLRFIAVFPSMWIWGFSTTVFFLHQLVVALVEVLGLYIVSRQLTPDARSLPSAIGWSFLPVSPLLRFALSIAFTSSVWALLTQTDKLVLSGVLPLAEYGTFTLAVQMAGGILMVGGPISNAVMPRLAKLHAEGRHEELILVYRQATRLVSATAGAAALTLTFCAEPLMYAWTGNQELAQKVAPILRLYAIGNGLLALSAFPYYLQYARGNLRYHLWGNLVMGLLLTPSIVLMARSYGAVGAGMVWLLMNFFYFLIWVGFVHHKLEPGLHASWIRKDVAQITLPGIAAAYIISLAQIQSDQRSIALGYTLALGGTCLVSMTAMLPIVRQKISSFLGRNE